ncbi:unnamed protein product [[Actinomadura] parvosata subsp. kistnae]|uniref:hypothetical protein n=1 Tax=[Actinomadura] parvosata TaxID=1955412 RepID=UPI000D26A2E9|nr:unnamed protein product [Actinomadura parvosata subsp. kistnae]
MDDGLTTALKRLREVFARYPRRAVLDGCPHCRGSVRPDEHDLFALTISLGNTVGSVEDVKSLLPLLLERLVTGDELDAGIVLGKPAAHGWRSWPQDEQDAVEGYLMAVWRSLLSGYPPRAGSFGDAAGFLGAAGELTGDVGAFLGEWDTAGGPAANRHLADLVTGWAGGARLPAEVLTWLHGELVRDRLLAAFERDHDSAWADDLARAYDLLGWRAGSDR